MQDFKRVYDKYYIWQCLRMIFVIFYLFKQCIWDQIIIKNYDFNSNIETKDSLQDSVKDVIILTVLQKLGYSYNSFLKIGMSKQQSEFKKSVLQKVRSLQKSITLGNSKSKAHHEAKSPGFTRSQKKQIQAQAKQVKNKIGKFLSKLKSKADTFLKQSQQYSRYEKSEYVEEQSLTNDPYQFRKNNPIILQKGLKKNQKLKPILLSNQYFNQKPTQIQNENLLYQLHPLTKNIKDYNDTVTTASSDKKIKKQVKLQDFQIGKQLGAGKYGHVYIARHKKTGIAYALKKVSKGQVDDAMMKQIAHQIKIQMFLDHPNIVRLYSYFNDKDSVYLLLELCTSGHLYDFLQKKIFIEQGITKNIVKQICNGLLHLHKHNIIHRDVKLQNILYQLGLVKICDFGWSIQTEDLRETFCGTPLYIAPEILLQKGYDRKIDVWCVGILTYELLYGKVPFQIREQKDFMKIINQQVQFPSSPSVSKSARNFIVQCLMKDPELRPNFDELLNHPFLQKCDYLKPSQLF